MSPHALHSNVRFSCSGFVNSSSTRVSHIGTRQSRNFRRCDLYVRRIAFELSHDAFRPLVTGGSTIGLSATLAEPLPAIQLAPHSAAAIQITRGRFTASIWACRGWLRVPNVRHAAWQLVAALLLPLPDTR